MLPPPPPPPLAHSASSMLGGGIDVTTPAGASVLALRQAISEQKSALAEAEAQMAQLLAAESARLSSELAAARAHLERMAAELELERVRASEGEKQLVAARSEVEAARAEAEGERARADKLGRALATAMSQLKDPAGPELDEMVAMADAVLDEDARQQAGKAAARARQPPPAKVSGLTNGGCNGHVAGASTGASAGVSGASTASAPPSVAATALLAGIPARLSTAGLPPPPPLGSEESETMMGDLYDDEEGDEYEGGLPRKSPARPPRAPPPPPPPQARPPPPPPPPPPATAGAAAGIAPVASSSTTSPLRVAPLVNGAVASPDFDPLVRMLHGLGDGMYSSEELRAHVGLAGSLLLATDQRLLYVKKNPTQLFWQVPIDSVASAEQNAASSQVILKLEDEPERPSTRAIDCMTPAVVPLVLDTVRRAMEQRKA